MLTRHRATSLTGYRDRRAYQYQQRERTQNGDGEHARERNRPAQRERRGNQPAHAGGREPTACVEHRRGMRRSAEREDRLGDR